MIEKKMDQRTKADRVVGNGNWEKYMWPHQIDKTAEPVKEKKSKRPATHQIINKTNNVGQGAFQLFNAFDSTFSGDVNYHDHRNK